MTSHWRTSALNSMATPPTGLGWQGIILPKGWYEYEPAKFERICDHLDVVVQEFTTTVTCGNREQGATARDRKWWLRLWSVVAHGSGADVDFGVGPCDFPRGVLKCSLSDFIAVLDSVFVVRPRT